MPSDFAPKEKKTTKKPVLAGKLWIIVPALVTLFAFYSLSRVWLADFVEEPILAESTDPSQEEENISITPPPREYEFYEILSAEKAAVIERKEPKQNSPELEYSLLVEYFISYDRALTRSKELTELKITPIKVEPYGSDLRFRLRIGPYLSRSQMNTVRDILFHHEIPHRVIARKR